MINRLKGTVDSIHDDYLVLDVNGVGYGVFCSVKTLSALPVGTAVALDIVTQVREDHIHLFGFMTATERQWFNTLTAVQGVGAKVALAIMGALSPTELTTAIASQDKTAICRANGVGPKLGLRICTELKDKVAKMTFATPDSTTPPTGTGDTAENPTANPTTNDTPPTNTMDNPILDDAVSALVNLGYGRSDAFTAVAESAKTMDTITLDTLITTALTRL